MAEHRWQPPPMNPSQTATNEPEPKVRVDEKVVRKMLQVNPGMRKGRTTVQVKKALEQGSALGSVDSNSDRDNARPGGPSAAHEFEETVGYFVRGKGAELRAKLADLETKRRGLDDEERALKQALRDQVMAFVAMLDAQAVATFGSGALAKHAEALRALGTSPADVLDCARRARR